MFCQCFPHSKLINFLKQPQFQAIKKRAITRILSEKFKEFIKQDNDMRLIATFEEATNFIKGNAEYLTIQLLAVLLTLLYRSLITILNRIRFE